MISQHQLRETGVEVGLSFQIRLVVFSHIMIEHSNGYDEWNEPFMIIFNHFN